LALRIPKGREKIGDIRRSFSEGGFGILFLCVRVTPGIFVGAGHALGLHCGFIFIRVRVSPGIFVGAGHALRLHCGFISIHAFGFTWEYS
jgi:hypothetical protein